MVVHLEVADLEAFLKYKELFHFQGSKNITIVDNVCDCHIKLKVNNTE